MAATAYAYLVSLLNTVDQIQIHPLLSTCFHNYQFLSLREKVDFLLDFVENHSDTVISEKVDYLVDADSTDAEDLLSRIAVASQKAEDIIEVEAADQIRDGSTEKSPSFSHNLQKIIQDMDSIIRDEVIKMKEERPSEEQLHSSSMDHPSTTAKTATTMVGFGGYLEQVLDELTGYHSGRRVLPIVGMGGIGKTTLARNAYEHMLTLHHFDVRVWVTVSQTFSVRDILLQALSCVGGSTTTTDDQSTSKTDDQLGEELRKILYCRRYLIVLDDVWSVEAWEKMQFCFPENFNRSRIVVTTRVQKLVNYFASSSLVVDFLDDKNSWDLFCRETFAQEGCPPGLEKVGKMIVKKCKGLPLAISVIGGLLCKSPKTQQYWKKISKDKSLVLKRSGEGNKALNILYLSYKHLPVCLKSCFLHLGLFPEDHQIDVSQVIQLWVAEGYIKETQTKAWKKLQRVI